MKLDRQELVFFCRGCHQAARSRSLQGIDSGKAKQVQRDTKQAAVAATGGGGRVGGFLDRRNPLAQLIEHLLSRQWLWPDCVGVLQQFAGRRRAGVIHPTAAWPVPAVGRAGVWAQAAVCAEVSQSC